MTIDKAVEILHDILNCVQPGDPPDEHDAVNLGIEALKLVKAQRIVYLHQSKALLPFETPE